MDNKLIYLMGAGRSGTTALATLLGKSTDVVYLGELHHLPEYTRNNSHCSCGESFTNCKFWSQLQPVLTAFSTEEYRTQRDALESHCAVPRYIGTTFASGATTYQTTNLALLEKVQELTGKTGLDSAKYVGRALALSRNKHIDLRIIYMTRDPRGVIESFAKKVQTPKSTFNACIYYNVINLLAEIATRTTLRGKVLKLRYEDLLANPLEKIATISEFTGINGNEIAARIRSNLPFTIGHIVGGNRLSNTASLRFRTSDQWRGRLSPAKRVLVYFLTLPFNLLNRYKL